MIVRDLSPIPYQQNMPLGKRLRGLLRFGLGWPKQMQSQQSIIAVLSRLLDNSYTLLRNVTLQKGDDPIPLILVGPQGVYTLLNDPTFGIFRARGADWFVYRSSDGSFRPTKPNQIAATQALRHKVETFLRARGFNDVPVEGLLVLTNPRTHADAIRAEVRVLLIDGLERFAAQLASSPQALAREQRFKMVEGIVETSTNIHEAPQEKKRRLNLPVAETAQAVDTRFTRAVQPAQRWLNFTTRQWLILGGIALAEVCILAAFLLLVFMTA